MRVMTDHLIETLSGHGGQLFQHFVWDLVAAACHNAGIPLSKIRYDSRVNIADQGRDIIVSAGAKRLRSILPTKPSVWSVKAGEDGLQPKTLRRELRDAGHTELRSILRKGGSYVWCALQHLDQAGRDKM